MRSFPVLALSLIIFLFHGEKAMSNPKVMPYGSWESPITSKYLVKDKIRLGPMHIHDDAIYWIEGRPKEKGRQALVKWKKGKAEDILPLPYNARTKVHEYGGNCFVVCGEEVYFSNFSDNRLYHLIPGKEPTPLTENEALRFADPVWNSKTDQLFMVCEDHTKEGEPGNYLVAFNLKEHKGPIKIAEGHDFYSSPSVSPDGKKIAWTCWNHPNLPWDGTELWLAKIDDKGTVYDAKCLAGGMEESIIEPKWLDNTSLFFISDKSGFWNLYRYKNAEIEAIHPMAADFGIPSWVFGSTRYDFLNKNAIACLFTEKGIDYLGTIDLKTSELKRIETPFSSMGDLKIINENSLLFKASSPEMPACIVKWNTQENSFEILKKSAELDIDPRYISIPQEIAFPSEGGKEVYAFYYPPTNPDFQPKKGELPPLLVLSHGGPSAHTSPTLDLKTQFWTSRGFAVVDVNYGGSTGYGRNYRERLNNNWGIVDVDDCTNAALYLTKKELADPDRLAIAGGSAGGYTTLAALTFRNVFKAGASYFGISDLEALATFTHKFEARYLDRLVAPYPEQKQIYYDRSPIHFTEKLSCPVILLQGAEDMIVPPSQSEKMHETLKKKGIPTAYLLFENEQHGFRSSHAIRKAIEAEYYFYSKIFGFTPTEEIKPIEIDNLEISGKDPKSQT